MRETLKSWVAPSIILTILMFSVTMLGSYIGRIRAEASANAEVLAKLEELSRKADENTKKIDIVDERLRTQVVSKELFNLFIDSQKEYNAALKEQIQLVRQGR